MSLLSPFTTLFVAPLICFWALPLGLIASLAFFWSPALSKFIFHIGSIGLQGAIKITALASEIPFSSWKFPPPSLLAISIYYLFAFLILAKVNKRIHKIGLLTSLFAVLILSVTVPYPSSPSTSTQVTFIDTGQGSSTLVELPGNKNILIDGGGSYSPRFDPGEQIITPFLWHKNIRHLDAMVISHVHSDHYNGLKSVVTNFKPDKIWINGSHKNSSSYLDLIKTAQLIGLDLAIPEKGSTIIESGQAKLSCISDLHLRDDRKLAENNRSLVLKLEMAGRKFILPGDIMVDDGEILVKEKLELESDVLLAPHHGSKYSAGYDLVKHGNPDWLVVSSSPFYSEQYPDPDFTKWCDRNDIKILNTAKSGSISFRVDEQGVIECQLISEKARMADKQF